jgi:hypothetical protein
MAMKKGFFFTTDGFLAIILFTVIILGLFSYYISAKSLTQQYYYSEDLLNIFSNVKISELDPIYYPSIQTILNQPEEYNSGNVIIQQINVFYEQNQELSAIEMVEELTTGLVPEKYGFGIIVKGEDVYSAGKENITALVSRQKIVKGGDFN